GLVTPLYRAQVLVFEVRQNARSGSSQIGTIGRGSANRDTRAPLRVEVLLIQIHQDGKMGSFCADVFRCGYNPARQSVLDAKVPLINFWLHSVGIHGTEADLRQVQGAGIERQIEA